VIIKKKDLGENGNRREEVAAIGKGRKSRRRYFD
jgi:hypothetical protein